MYQCLKQQQPITELILLLPLPQYFGGWMNIYYSITHSPFLWSYFYTSSSLTGKNLQFSLTTTPKNTCLKLILCYSLTKIYCPNNGGPKHVLATSICGWVTKWFRGHVVVCKPRGKLIVTNITIVIVGISMLDKCSTRGLDLILSWAV